MKILKYKRIGLIAVLFIMFTICQVEANVSLPNLFSNNMMFQRNQPIHLWGEADRKERIQIDFLGQTYNTRAGNSGMWSIEIPSTKAGGPFEMTIKGKNIITLSNILIGDIWVCSGQSNMDWPLRKANNAEEEINNAKYPEIRIFKLVKHMAVVPQSDVLEGSWETCNPESIPGFSAVGYFFGRFLHQELEIPIGLIGTSWGGTNVETWTSKEGFKGEPYYEPIAQEVAGVDLEQKKNGGDGEYAKWIEEFQKSDMGVIDGEYVWSGTDFDYKNWSSMNLPQPWELSEDEDMREIDGVVWFMKEVELTNKQAQYRASVSLGPIDDSDITWINGIKIGETKNRYSHDRKYAVPEDCLKEGKNQIVIRVEDYSGNGGLYGVGNQLFLQLGSEKISLSGEWKYNTGMVVKTKRPANRFDPNSLPTLLYNAMIAPLIQFPIKGAIWYQGESNASRAYQYRDHFKRLITDWRVKWDIGDFPFLFVQLANFMDPDAKPVESAWAELREAQDMALSLPNTGMASAIDIGEADDIHPRNKQDVGYRLGLEALRITYSMNLISAGPRYDTMEIRENEIHINFSNTGEGLVVKDKYQYLKGFTIAGNDKKFYWARAELVDESTVKVYSNSVQNPVAVRYAWANNPDQANLYNSANLPGNPFRTDDWEGITAKNR
ncbi:MAG: 9-O-acetylesterase [Bacteroidales bacterium]|nr:9-O-acetylesterase [Bacteroidales bacterium]